MNSVSRCKIVYNVILVKVVESEFPINHARNCIVPDSYNTKRMFEGDNEVDVIFKLFFISRNLRG